MFKYKITKTRKVKTKRKARIRSIRMMSVEKYETTATVTKIAYNNALQKPFRPNE